MDTTNTTAPARFVPAILFPLPMHHGMMVFGLTVVALVAVGILWRMFSKNDRELF